MITITAITEKRAPIFAKAKTLGADRDRAFVRKNTAGMKRKVRVFFKQTAKQLSQFVLNEFGKVSKADETQPLPDNTVTQVLNWLDGEVDWDDLSLAVDRYIIAVAVDGASIVSNMISSTGVSINDQLATDNAALWGRHRAAELVGRKWVDGRLVDNPNARWAINSSTRDIIAAEVNAAVANGSTASELAAALQESAAFSESRAMMVARTEMALADVAGAMESYKACPTITGKRWVTAGDDRVSEECQACEDEGDIPMGQAFSTGAQAPPNHPNCRCTIVPVFADEMTN